MPVWHFQLHLAHHTLLVVVAARYIRRKGWSFLEGEEPRPIQVVHRAGAVLHIAAVVEGVHHIAADYVEEGHRNVVAVVEGVHHNVHHPCAAADGVAVVGCELAAVGGDVAGP